MGAIPSRYAVTVIPIDSGTEGWWPRVEVADEAGNIVKSTDVVEIRFATTAEAEHAGWIVAENWIRRSATAGR